MKKTLALLICFILCFLGTSICVEARTNGEFTYAELDDGTAEITGYSGYGDILTIPNELDGLTVTSIGNMAFKDCLSLISLIIPDGVISIGEWAFCECRSLTSVTIPDSVTSIGNWAFSDCQNLTSVFIPDSVTSIGECTFSGCRSLTSVTIPNSVTSIGEYTFSGCRSLTSVTIPDSVTAIGYGAFLNCENLTSINIPDRVISIEGSTFYGCRSLTSVTIPYGVISIGDMAFQYCHNLASVTIPDSVISIGRQAFMDCPMLTSVSIPDSVSSIGPSAFYVDSDYFAVLKEASLPAPCVRMLDEDIKPGDYVTFGHYEQDNDRSDGSEEIEWLILSIQDDKALLISHYALDSAAYNNQFGHVTWQDCDLRAWLNEDFLKTAFSAEEIARIQATDVDNSINQGNKDWDTDGGNNTKDKIFLLSCKEVEQYFPSRTSRACKPTAYGLDQGIYSEDGLCSWLLRSPGEDQFKASYILCAYGSFQNTIINSSNAIRPALWVDLKSEQLEPNCVYFGNYEQDNNRPNGFEKIEWIVLDVEDGKALLISRYGLEAKQKNNKDWQNCDLRAWLNKEFLKTAFSDEEKAAILATEVDNSISQGNKDWGTDGGNNTTDKIFLLSYREVEQYFPSETGRICKPTAYGADQGIVQTNGGCNWWLRSSGDYVNADGTFGRSDVNIDTAAVRPAFWIDMESVIFKSENPEYRNQEQQMVIGMDAESGRELISNTADKAQIQMSNSVNGYPSWDDVVAVGDENRVKSPSADTYLPEYKAQYINAPKGNHVYVFRSPGSTRNPEMIEHGAKVYVLAEDGKASFIIYRTLENKPRSGWVNANVLSDTYPGYTVTVGTPYDVFAENIGDPSTTWSEERMTGTNSKYVILNEPIEDCVGFTLEYRAQYNDYKDCSGTRNIYINDGTGWIYVGNFQYENAKSFHIEVNLDEPSALHAVATPLEVEQPDTFSVRTNVLDVQVER